MARTSSTIVAGRPHSRSSSAPISDGLRPSRSCASRVRSSSDPPASATSASCAASSVAVAQRSYEAWLASQETTKEPAAPLAERSALRGVAQAWAALLRLKNV